MHEIVATPKDGRWYRKIPDTVITDQDERYNANIEDPKEVAFPRQIPSNTSSDPML